MTNLEMIHNVHKALREVSGKEYDLKLEFTNSRPTDDFRYAIDCSKIKRELGWEPNVANFDSFLKNTVRWYV